MDDWFHPRQASQAFREPAECRFVRALGPRQVMPRRLQWRQESSGFLRRRIRKTGQ